MVKKNKDLDILFAVGFLTFLAIVGVIVLIFSR